MTRPHHARLCAAIVVWTLTTILLAFSLPPIARAQDPEAQDPEAQNAGTPDTDDQERIVVDRYLQVLLRRPRPGVALDRVYGYHIQNDSLDQLREQLIGNPATDDAGSRQMVWGLIQLQRGQSADAAKILSAAESLLSDDAACSFYLGRAYLAVGQTEQAAAAMERAIDRGPQRSEALPMFTELGRIYSRAGESDKSLSVWTRLEQLFPGDARVGGQIASTLAEEGNIEAAKQRYDRLAAESEQPDQKIAFAVQAAEMQRRMGQVEQATEALEQILARLRPGSWLHTDVRSRIEAGFLKSGDVDALADYYQQQLTGRPDDLVLRIRLARIMVTAGRLTEAQRLLESAVQRAPDDIDARLTLIDVLVQQNAIPAAAEQFQELEKLDPGNPDHLIRWGQVLLDDGETPLEDRRDAAAKIWLRLAAARSDDAVTLSQIADRMRGIDRSDAAIKLYRQAIEIEPSAPQYREYLGEYLFTKNRKDEAIEVWQSIAADDRRGRESLVRLAEVMGTFKLTEHAMQAWQDASAFDLTFAQELRYAEKLVEAQSYDQASARLDVAAKIAETPDELDQLLQQRIAVYQESGQLQQQIARLAAQSQTVESLRRLALMYGACGDLTLARQAIRKAVSLEPDNMDLVLVAADLAERQNRLADAVELFKTLAADDIRYRTNYLQRVAGLQIRLGATDDAFQTCEAIIDANPASPESYLFYARMAFDVHRDEAAVAALRRAMSVAPRDILPRRMLAGYLANRYRTDEAIDLYWQALRLQNQPDDKINLIRAMAPLYERKSDLEALVGRIEELNRQDGDPRMTRLMTAAAYEAVGDFGAARDVIDQLLAVQPRDLQLLETMVRLTDLANEMASAAEYQQRINELADTPENRFKLLQYQMDAGIIDATTALSQRIAFDSDPSRLRQMIQSASRRGELKTAQEICRQALQADDSLWDIKLLLSQLLLIDRSGDDFESDRALAMQLAREVRAAKLPDQTLPPTGQTTPNPVPANGSAANRFTQNPVSWKTSIFRIALALRVGRYSGAQYYSVPSNTLLEPVSFGHARIAAASLILLNSSLEKSGAAKTGAEARQAVQQELMTEFDLPDLDQVTDLNVLWEQQILLSLLVLFSEDSPSARTLSIAGPNDESEIAQQLQRRQWELLWRLVQLDPIDGLAPLFTLLSQRLMYAPASSPVSIDRTPLTDQQLQRLSEINQNMQVTGFPAVLNQGSLGGNPEIMMHAILANELKIAGRQDQADRYASYELSKDSDFDTINGAIQFYLRLNQQDKADQLVQYLLPAARRGKPQAANPNPSPVAQLMLRVDQPQIAFQRRHAIELLDAVIAHWSHANLNATNRSLALGNGYVRVYSKIGNSFRPIQLRGPLSPRLMNSELAQQVAVFSASLEASERRSPISKLQLPAELTQHLQQPIDGASDAELKTRGVVAAFAYWWADQPQLSHALLTDLCDQFPTDVDLQIERARLASELNQPRLALETLDSFNPLDSQMLIRKELAAMNLASEIGDGKRARLAAERLFGMRLDVQTQLSLVQQLKLLGMNDESKAMLQRTRSGRMRDENTELQIAQAFLDSGDSDAAAEVAYSLWRRLSIGRSARDNAEHYQRRAVVILKSANRLEPLIERAKRRVASTPKAIRPKKELANLYTAAGRVNEANQVWRVLSDEKPNTAQQMIARADDLVKAGKNDAAVMMYLDAFEKDNNQIASEFNKLSNAMRSAGGTTTDRAFKRLMNFPLDKIPSYRISSMAQLGNRTQLSTAKRKFIGYLLQSPAGKAEFFGITRYLTAAQREQIPEYRAALIDYVCSANSFEPNAPQWAIRSRSINGTASGALALTIELLQDDRDARQKFRAAAEQAMQNDSQKSTAALLLALVDLDQTDLRQQSFSTIKQCVHRDADNPDANLYLDFGLLWQAGQLLESMDDVPSDVLIDLYKEAKRVDTSSYRGPQYSVDKSLVDVYQSDGQYGNARALLMRLFQDNDYSIQNQSNPGYGDLQQLQAYQWIAEELLNSHSPIDALVVYRTALLDPAAIERAGAWGRSVNYFKTFEQGAKLAVSKITPAIAVDHLNRLLDLWEQGIEIHSVRLMEVQPRDILKMESPSSLALAMRTATESEDQHEQVLAFKKRLDKLAESNPKSWQLTAVQLMAACYLGSDDVTAIEQELFQRLPKLDTLDQNASGSVAIQAVFDLYPTARAASQSDRKVDQQIGQRLVEYISVAAEQTHQTSMVFALARLGGDGPQSTAKILDLIAHYAKPNTPLQADLVDECLQIAVDAANAGELELATRALTLALGNGPPLRQVSGGGGDAFALAPAPRSRSVMMNLNHNQPSEMDQLVDKVTAVTQALSQSTGVALTMQKINLPTKRGDDASERIIRQITDAYLAIVAPAGTTDSVFTYSQPIAEKDRSRRTLFLKIKVVSASLALAKAAAKCGQSNSIYETLKQRFESGTDRSAVAIAMVQVATAARDPDRLDDALTLLAKSLDVRLPPADQPGPSSGGTTMITIEMQNESFQKTETINLVLDSLWPILESNYLTELHARENPRSSSISAKIVALLGRTEALIGSDGYTAGRHRDLKALLSATRISIAKTGDPQLVDQHIRSRIDEIDQKRYPAGSNVQLYKRQALEKVTIEMLGEGLVNQMDQVFRKWIDDCTPADRDYEYRYPARMCLAISQLPPRQQIQLLDKVTFGRKGDQPIDYFTGLVCYEIPPPLVRRQLPLLQATMDLKTSVEDYPVVNSLLMLIDLAAKQGQTDSLMSKLEARTQTPGDQADIAIALLQIAIADASGDAKDRDAVVAQIQPTVQAVAAQLGSSLPQQATADLPFPELEMHLIVRAFRSGLPLQIAEPMIRDAKVYAVRGSRNLLISAVARASAKMGVGRAAGGTVESPLEDFILVPIAAQNRPDNVWLPPLYALRPDGSISGTSGYDQSHLMFKYPLSGSFRFSATIQDGAWGETDVAYGGVIFRADGWQKQASLLGMGGRGQVVFEVPSILKGQENVESVAVSPESVIASCNGQDYVTDIASTAYPFVSVPHHNYRTTQFRALRFSGNPKIPDAVNLIDPMMRGWGVITSGRPIPKMLLPIGPQQNAEKILAFRKQMESDLAKGPLQQSWSVVDGQLYYTSQSTAGSRYDPPCHIEYLRPIQEGESIEFEFWWRSGETEFWPTIGRTRLKLGHSGTRPDWIPVSADLASASIVAAEDLQPPLPLLATDNFPNEDAWNNLMMKREGDQVEVSLNDRPVLTLPVQGYERPGIFRESRRDLQIRKIRLTGNWPDQVPDQWMQK
ncbi:tetratricopeptide repeat protein [Stieleria sp. TO1_6]|uniref:tetratricopeptide repeat protein n=1 Tax=Stieleria tagensis TaxID=2956795 RepID=UPI00209B293B|nr:tetratricopeptide repeat protein [Stieleria tagensis]MCO8121797.1 tetratricopeptide repeat protein [Stieleria tagensis]